MKPAAPRHSGHGVGALEPTRWVHMVKASMPLPCTARRLNVNPYSWTLNVTWLGTSILTTRPLGMLGSIGTGRRCFSEAHMNDSGPRVTILTLNVCFRLSGSREAPRAPAQFKWEVPWLSPSGVHTNRGPFEKHGGMSSGLCCIGVVERDDQPVPTGGFRDRLPTPRSPILRYKECCVTLSVTHLIYISIPHFNFGLSFNNVSLRNHPSMTALYPTNPC